MTVSRKITKGKVSYDERTNKQTKIHPNIEEENYITSGRLEIIE